MRVDLSKSDIGIFDTFAAFNLIAQTWRRFYLQLTIQFIKSLITGEKLLKWTWIRVHTPLSSLNLYQNKYPQNVSQYFVLYTIACTILFNCSGDHLIKSLIGRAVESTITKIETPATSELLNKEKDTVIDLMMATCQPKLDALRELDKKTFDVPPHVLLIKDFELEQQVTEEEEHAKAAELEKLKLRYRQVSTLNRTK